MERDALIAHGTAFLLQDRLMNCSDYSTAWVCKTCGSMITLGYDDLSKSSRSGLLSQGVGGPGGEYCRVCRAKTEDEAKTQTVADGSDVRMQVPSDYVLRSPKAGEMDIIAVPYVFRYLCAELASMGIALSLEVA